MDYISSFAIFVLIFGNAFAEYTEAEQKALKTFREMISNELTEDFQKKDSFLMHWLKAKDMNINEATDMFLKAQKWRQEQHVNTISNETVIDAHPYPFVVDGYDKQGHPLVVFAPCHIDLRRLILQGPQKRDSAVRIFWQAIEIANIKTREASEKFGKEITQAAAIVDLHGFNLRQHGCLACLSVYYNWFESLGKYFPEITAHFVVINAPRVAIPIIELIKPFMDKSTRKALIVFPSDKKVWSAHLNKIVDADQLPFRIGGTRKP